MEFWTLEPTMSSAIITMGRSPTACPFGKPSLSNRISSWIFFHYFHFRYSNNVYIPGHHTLPDDMEQSWVTCHHQVLSELFQSMPRQIVNAIEKIDSQSEAHGKTKTNKKNTNTIQILTQSGTHGKTTPWFAPGTAPVYGACGTLGGWEHEDSFSKAKKCPANTSRPKILPGGRTVASTTARVTLVTAAAATATALPLVMMRSAKICVYDMIIIRQERRGVRLAWRDSCHWVVCRLISGTISREPKTSSWLFFFQEVKWYVSANHAGGYSYRLCKMPERGIKDLTEECFQVKGQ